MDHTLLRAIAAVEAEIPPGVPRASYEIPADRSMSEAFAQGLREMCCTIGGVFSPHMSRFISRVTL